MFYKTLSLAAAISLGLLTTPTYCSNNNNNEEQATGPTTRFVTAEGRKAGFTHDDQNHVGVPVASLPQGLQYTIGFMSLGLQDSSPSQVRGQWINTLAMTCKTFANVVDCLPHLKVREGLTKEQFVQLLRHKTNLGSVNIAWCFCPDSIGNVRLLRVHPGIVKLTARFPQTGNLFELLQAESTSFLSEFNAVLAEACPELKELRLVLSNMEGCRLPALEDGAEFMGLYEEMISTPVQLKNLRSLDISECNILRRTPWNIIRASPNLEYLQASKSTLGIRAILETMCSTCVNIRSIDLRQTNRRGDNISGIEDAVSPDDIKSLGTRLPNLKALNIYGLFFNSSEEDQLTFVTTFPEMEELELHRVSYETAKRVAAISRKLRKLNLRECNELNLAQVLDVMGSGESLREFGLAERTQEIDGPEDFIIANACPNIRTLHFNSKGLTDNGALVLVKACPKLETLIVWRTGGYVLTHEGIMKILHECKDTLTTLDLYGSYLSHIEHVEAMLKVLPNLTKLVLPLNGNLSGSKDRLAQLVAMYPKVEFRRDWFCSW